MFKNIFYFVGFLFFFACSGANANVDKSVSTVDKSKKVQVNQVKQTQRDSLPGNQGKVNYKSRSNNSNYIVSTSRQKTEIKQDFPYDIELRTADGTVQKSDELFDTEKPTVILFWLTTCYPCRIEMKAIQGKYAQWKSETDFNLVAISTDFEKNYGKFQEMVETQGWEWDTYHDFNREFRYVMPGELNGLPQSFIIDKNGKIAYHKRKYRSGDEDKLYAKVKELAAL